LSVVVNTLNTLAVGLLAVPTKAKSRQLLQKIRDESLCSLRKDDQNDRILSFFSKSLTLDVVAWKSLLHRVSWFRSLAVLFTNPAINLPPDSEENFLSAAQDSAKWPGEHVVSYIKYYTVALYARFLKAELPDQPPGFAALGRSKFNLFGGSLGRWVSHRVIETRLEFSQKFFYSWYQTKRGCAPMDESDVQLAYEKHAKALSKPPPHLGESVLTDVRQKTSRLLSRFKLVVPREVDFEFSHNACFMRSRASGGTWADVQGLAQHCLADAQTPRVIQRRVGLTMKPYDVTSEYIIPSRVVCEPLLLRIFPPDLVSIACDFLSSDPSDFYREEIAFETYHLNKRCELGVDKERDRDGLRPPDYETLLGLATTHFTPDVMVAPILEPLKVRLVSKGCSTAYTAAMPVQKQMHTFLRRMPALRLIGEPLESSHLEWLVQHKTSVWIASDPDHVADFNSGDYSAATDNLNIHLTKTIFEEALGKFTQPENPLTVSLKEICRHVLYEQQINYPRDSVPRFRQGNGQLMGSPLSFPVLCLANLIGFWISLELYARERSSRTGETLRKFKFEDVAALINGDDILSLTNDSLFSIWRKVMSDFGLELSPGKSVRHPYLFTINSQQWRFNRKGPDPRSCTGDFTYIPYFAVGLLVTGGETKEVKVQGAAGSDELITRQVQDLSSTWNDLRPTAFDQCRAFAMFLKLHKESLSLLSRRGQLNYFASRQGGGLGFDPPDPGADGPWEFEFTRAQRRLCFLRHIDNAGRVVCKSSRDPFSRPVLARVVVKDTYPNVDLNPSDGFFLACPIYPDGIDVSCPPRLGGSWIPLIDDPDLVLVNSSKERFESAGRGMIQPEFELTLPSDLEIQSLYREKDWSSGLATVEEMRQEYLYQPVRFFKTEEIPDLVDDCPCGAIEFGHSEQNEDYGDSLEPLDLSFWEDDPRSMAY
jgi:hypothetical protein